MGSDAMNRARHGFAALVLAHSMIATTTVAAQVPDTIHVNQRLRARRVPSMQRVTGTLLAKQGDTLLVRADAGFTEQLLTTSLTDIERSRGLSASAGAKKGALWGAGIGVLGGPAGVVLGVAIGSGIGAHSGGETWAPAVLPARLPASVTTAVAAAAPAPTPTLLRDSSGSTAFPDQRAALAPGYVVRFATRTTPRVLGTVTAVESDSLRITNGVSERAYEWNDVSRLQRYYGRTARGGGRRVGTIGAIVGSVSFGLLGAAAGSWGGESAGVAAGAAMGAIVGAGYGFLISWPIGAALGGDDWRTVRRVSTP